MPLARWQATIVNEAGNIMPSAFVEVRREVAGAPLASLFSDRDGASGIGNPFQADAEGFAAFHVAGGAYKIRAYAAGFERIWRYAGIGTGAENDFATVFAPQGAWSVATTYETGHLVSHDDGAGGEPYAFVSNADGNLANEPQFASGTGISDTDWTVVGLISAPGAPGSSDVVGTSVSSVAIGTGTKTFTVVESDRGWGLGARLRLSSDSNPITHWMEGVVTAYSGVTLEISADLVAGSGSRADWTINLAGMAGVPGYPVFEATAIAGTANAIEATVPGMIALSADPQFVWVTPTANNTTAVTIKFNGGAFVALKSPMGVALAADEWISGVPYQIRVTSTDARIRTGASW